MIIEILGGGCPDKKRIPQCQKFVMSCREGKNMFGKLDEYETCKVTKKKKPAITPKKSTSLKNVFVLRSMKD